MIYFAQDAEGGAVKIGTTEDVPARLRQLESHYGKPLALLATRPGGRAEEAELHARFAHLRYGRTEQFRPAPDLMEFIGRPLLVSANPDAVEAMPDRTHDPLRHDVTLKADSTVIGWAKLVAKARGISLAEYVSEVLRGPVGRDFAAEMERLKGKPK